MRCCAFSSMFEKDGFRVIGTQEAGAELIATPGVYGRHKPTAQALEADIALAAAHRAPHGRTRYRPGRCGVRRPHARGGSRRRHRCDAGTRIAHLPTNVRGTPDKPRGVLLKASKPNQDRKTDLPVIGAETVRKVSLAGLRGIAVEAGGALIVRKQKIVDAADRLGIVRRRVRTRNCVTLPMTAPLSKPLTLMLVAGEPSGDQLGAELMMALRALGGDALRIVGVGGAAMTAQGLHSLYPLDATAVMGLREVVPRIPEILRRVRIASDYAVRERPDAVVCIDSPDFTHRIARRIKRLAPDIRTVNYVAPQVWASRQYRAKKMSHYFDLVLALFPFEVPFFEAHGQHAIFTGHPVIERAAWMTGGDALRARLGIAPDAPLLCVLPGSRASEVRFLLPPFRAAVARIAREIPESRVRAADRAQRGRAGARRGEGLGHQGAGARRRRRQIRRVPGG